MHTPIHIAAFYNFFPIEAEELDRWRQDLQIFGQEQGLRGLVLLAEEGINGTVCGKPEAIDAWKREMEQRCGEMMWNDSEAQEHVYRRWMVKIREEIVALKQQGVHPQGERNHLSPEEWEEMLARGEATVIDARNTYETAIGMFEGAVDPKTRTFAEFSTFAESTDLPREKPVMLYCTGGIRCEKAVLEMQKRGFQNVYQLKGGILAYLKQFPNRTFKGECFVFDHRAAVDQHLRPSTAYALCPHCGDPGRCDVSCARCTTTVKLCDRCSNDTAKHACSKQCRSEMRLSQTAGRSNPKPAS